MHVWTLNTRAEIEQALDLGADGVMTDEVALLREILTERGQWHPRVSATPATPVARERRERRPVGVRRPAPT